MKSPHYSLKPRVIELRKAGKTYGEIIKLINQKIPKSTLSGWCHDIYLTGKQINRINKTILENSKKGLAVAHAKSKEIRSKYIHSIIKKNKNLGTLLKNKKIAKITLATLYMCEGSKRASIALGNSSPNIIQLFLRLLRFCYPLDEKKFRCTVQCREDQDTEALKEFWSELTNIPVSQFYKPQIDRRTIGKPTKHVNYMGVCRVDYFSAHIFTELAEVGKILYNAKL